MCQVKIERYSIVNAKTKTESDEFAMELGKAEMEGLTAGELLRLEAGGNGGQGDDSNLFESFDHQYFEQEVHNLIDLRGRVERERFYSRGGASRSSIGDNSLEWHTLQQVDERLQDIAYEIENLEPFDAAQRMQEIHEINETLIKIRAGRFETVLGNSDQLAIVGSAQDHQQASTDGGTGRQGHQANQYGAASGLRGFDVGLLDLEYDEEEDYDCGYQGRFQTHKIKLARNTGKVHLQHAKKDPVSFLLNSGLAAEGQPKVTCAAGGIASRKKNKKNKKKGQTMKVQDNLTGEEIIVHKNDAKKEWLIK